MPPGVLPPLVKAKLSPPKVGDACLRDETLAMLARHLRRRVTLMCAPAGYGKTTVALEAIGRLGLRTVWYKLDVLDQDPVVLIVSLVEALSRLRSGFGQTIRDRLANAHEVAYPVEQMAAEFVTEVADKITGDLHIALDDYHEAADSPALNATLDYLVTNLPEDVRFIVLTRYEPAFGIAKLKLDDELGVVGVDQLRFGPSEVLEVVRRRSGISLPLARAEGLADLTEGWPASVVLAALAVRLVGVDALESALADPRLRQDVFSYLAEQVYARETPEVRAFLRRTCCLEHVSVDLATRVRAPRRAHRILAHLQANGVFTFATDQEGTYRYHGLFREFLRQKSIQEDGPARFHARQLETAAALEATGDVEKAVDLCLVANEPRLALDVIARAGEKNLDAFRSDTLESWLERLPAHIRRDEPWAGLVAGQVHMRAGRFDEALRDQTEAAERFELASDHGGLYHALSAQERTLYWQGDISQAAAICSLALAVADLPEQRVHTLISLGAALQSECRWKEAGRALAEAEDLAGGAFPAELARLAGHALYAGLNVGQYRRAAEDLETARHLVATHGSPSLQTTFLNLASTTYLFLTDWASARVALDAAYDMSRRYDYLFLEAILDDAEGQLRAAIGDYEGAARVRAPAISAPSIADDAHCLSMALCHAGTEARRSGNPESACNWYQRAVEAAGESVAPNAHLNASANLSFSLGPEGHSSPMTLDLIAERARRLDLEFVALKCEFFAAVLLYRGGRRAEAMERLSGCVLQQLKLGHLNFLAQEFVIESDMAAHFIGDAADAETAGALIDLVARHWNGMRLLVSCQALGPVAGVAATRAAVAHRSEAEISTVLAKASRSRFPEVRRAAAVLRRERRSAQGEQSLDGLHLTKRERQILGLMADGASNDDLASRLVLAPATVKTHVNHIFSKLGVKDRVQAVLLYRESAGESGNVVHSSTSRTEKPRQDTTTG